MGVQGKLLKCAIDRRVALLITFLVLHGSISAAPNGKDHPTRDSKRVAAEQAFKEGETLRAQATAPSFRKSIEKYQEALSFFREIADRDAEARTLTGIGRAYDALSEKRKALDYYNQALPLYRALDNRSKEASVLYYIALDYDYLGKRQEALDYVKQALAVSKAAGDRSLEAITLTYTAQIYDGLGDKQKALDFLNQALPLHRTVGNRLGEATTLSYIGNLFTSRGEIQKALENLNQALELYRALGARRDEAYTLTSIGTAYYSTDDYKKALGFYQQALPQWRTVGDRSGESATLHNIASAYERTGEYQKAIEFYSQSLPLHRAVDYKIGEANTLTNIGRLYSVLGDYEKALDFLNQALPLHKASSNRIGEASALNNIGLAYSSMGDWRKALDFYNHALPIMRSVGDRAKEADTINSIATIYSSTGDYSKALDYYNQALLLQRAVGRHRGEAQALAGIGSVQASLGEPQKALDFYGQALPLFRSISDRSGEAIALYGIARVEYGRNNLVEARSQIEQALTIVESLRSKVINQDLRSSYFASVRNYYDLDIDLLMQLNKQNPSEGFDAAGLQASERARARSLLEILAEARADIRVGVDPSLLERERLLQQLLNTKAERQMRLLGGKHTLEQAVTAGKEVETVTADYQQVEAQIRATSPRYAALTQPQILTLKETQQLLNRDTLLLEYALGNEHSYLWAVSPDSVANYELPERAEIEKAARRFYKLARTDTETPEFTEVATMLSQMLLSPAAALLGTKRLLVVAEGVLQYVPFAALPIPKQSAGRNPKATADYRPLITEHEIVNLPSASTLAVLRGETGARKPAPKTVAVLADPVFSSDDLRVKRRMKEHENIEVTSARSSQTRDLERSAMESGVSDTGLRLARLIGSRREAAAIRVLVPEGQRKQALDFEANRTTVISGELGDYRIVHFATHGLVNNVHPELSGLILSLVNERGEPQDGFLRLNEIYNLKLPAEIVVLSACQTGLGKEIKGEGLVGLTRGFMYAGAARVVTSLWKVDDQATSELMKYFYQGMLGPQKLSPSAALRAAQVAMSKQKGWESPYYWAAFVLQGEWK
ncbi:MAG TPA: CHAT domain-containing tetratricopeptide repeat protein [Acidobacteriota bacterium]|jgi:CHAT domain-containing protein/uncharacterized protein HemY|nr:CHAT domain-containing tetratricopeptide repeat protein [Acidobacteriota bacterium]